MSMENPFAPRTEPRSRNQRSVFVTHRPAPTRTEIAIEEQWRAHERTPKGGDRVTHAWELMIHLKEHGHPDVTIDAYRNDPWMYQPTLMNELIKEQITKNDPAAISKLCGLLCAGSEKCTDTTTEKEITETLNSLRASEGARWDWKIRHADPDSSKEYAETKKEILEQIEQIQHTLTRHAIGDEAEQATRSVEQMIATVWRTLDAELHVHGLSAQRRRERQTTDQLYTELESLRPIRDALYYRRLYPKLASKSLGVTT